MLKHGQYFDKYKPFLTQRCITEEFFLLAAVRKWLFNTWARGDEENIVGNLNINYNLPFACAKKSSQLYLSCLAPQFHHSYYFTTSLLVLKFANKGVFFEEIQDSHFPNKRGYFGTHLHEFGEKGVNFDVQCFTVKMGVHLDWEVSVLPQKRRFILDWKVSVLLRKRGCFELKSQCLPQKGGNFQTVEQGWVPLFSVSQGAGPSPVVYSCIEPLLRGHHPSSQTSHPPKDKSPAQCTHEMSQVVSKAKVKLPNATIVISLGTPREDLHELKHETVNGSKKCINTITPSYSVIIATSNMVVKPNLACMAADNYHLTENGNSRLQYMSCRRSMAKAAHTTDIPAESFNMDSAPESPKLVPAAT